MDSSRTTRRARIALLVGAAALATACSKGVEGNPALMSERPTYRQAVASIARRQAEDDSIAVPGARSILLTSGASTPRAVLLLHGLTDSPRQFEPLADLLHADGNNVYVPRLPQHGLRGGSARALGSLTSVQLSSVADSVVHDARGLGDSVIVMGLSMGGTMAAWIAQRRPVARAVLIAPAIEPGLIPSLLDRPLIGLGARLPSMTHISAPDTARPDRELGLNTRAIAAILTLGATVMGEASTEAPQARSIVLLVNASDRTVKTSATEALARAWAQHDAKVSVYELPDSLRLPHDIIDAIRGRALGDTVLTLLRGLAYGKAPPPWVLRLGDR